MIAEQLQKVFADRGITEGDVIDKYLDIYEKADREENPDLRIMKSVTDEFRDMLDMKPKELPRGSEIPHIQDAEVEETLLAEVEQAKLELGQKKLEAGEAKE